MTEHPNPGSIEARSKGCKCPMMDNGYGQGAYTDAAGVTHFWISAECGMHREANETTPRDPETLDMFGDAKC